MKKKTKSYFILLISFIVVMSLSLVFFMFRFENIKVSNEVNHLLKDLYDFEEGTYELKEGIIYQNEYKVNLKKYIKASGKIEVDKYKNVRFILSYEDKCINKTYMGNIEVDRDVCKTFKNLDVSLNRNNNKISFISKTKNLEYKISNKDDFNGEWIKEEYKDNLVLKSYDEGINYIWFKDSEGNLSKTLSFKVDCLFTSRAMYDNNVFYCSGSTVRLDNMDFVVIKDNALTIKLMKFLPLDDKLSHCMNNDDSYCFYKKDSKNTYNWENSYVNYYLNNVFIDKLSNKTKDALVDSDICVDINSKCGEESCIGRNRMDINNKKFTCNKYINSKIKLISYEEFNYVYSKTQNKDVLNGYYSMINSFYLDKGSAIQYDQSVYVYEDLNKKIDIKPVIILFK